jgi:hypothetical protein
MTLFGPGATTGGYPINGQLSGGFTPMAAGPIMTAPPAVPPNVMPANVAHALTEARRLQAAATLQRCYRWLEQAIQSAPQLGHLVPPLLTAVQLYEAEHYEACLAQTIAVMQVAQQLRSALPLLPPL